MRRHHLPRTGHTGLGGTGSPAQGVGGVSFRARGGVSFSKNRAHWPRGDGESSPGVCRSILQGPCGGIILEEPGTPAWGGRGVQPRGWSEYPSGPLGGASSSKNRAHWPGGAGSPAQGVVGVSFRAPRGGIIFQEPGTPAWGGRGLQPRGWSEYPSGPMGRHHLPRTGHTGLGGTGSPAQGVGGVSFRARGGVSFSKNGAHWPRGDGESSPGVGRSILQGPCGGIIFQEPGTPA